MTTELHLKIPPWQAETWDADIDLLMRTYGARSPGQAILTAIRILSDMVRDWQLEHEKGRET